MRTGVGGIGRGSIAGHWRSAEVSVRRALLCGLGTLIAVVLPGFMSTSLAPEIREDFPYRASALGLAIAVFFLVSALASAPSGRLVDRIGARPGIRLGGGCAAGSCLAIAAFAGSAPTLIALLATAGLGNAVGNTGVSALIVEHVDAERQGAAFGLQQAGPPFAAVISGLALPLLAAPVGWRWAFVAAAVVAAAAAIATPRPLEMRDTRKEPLRSARLRAVHALALTAALATAASVALVSFLVVFAVGAGLGAAEAGVLLAVASLIAGGTRIALGRLADRRRHTDPLVQVAILLSVAAIGFVVLAMGEVGAIIVLGAVLGGGVGWGWQGLVNLAVVRQSRDTPASAMGIEMAGLYIGAVIGPLVVGQIIERFGFGAGWSVCATASLLAAATALVARELSEREPDSAFGASTPAQSRSAVARGRPEQCTNMDQRVGG